MDVGGSIRVITGEGHGRCIFCSDGRWVFEMVAWVMDIHITSIWAYSRFLLNRAIDCCFDTYVTGDKAGFDLVNICFQHNCMVSRQVGASRWHVDQIYI